MTEIKREKVLAKIKALLNKTVANGCTEFEALAALTLARGLMDSHEVTTEDLQDIKRETADILNAEFDSLGIKIQLARAIADFCDCKVWKTSRLKTINYCGLPVDVELASYLTGSLYNFVRAELKRHMLSLGRLAGPEKRRAQNGFMLGCCSRISARLDQLTRESKAKQTSNSTALVVAKGALIASKMQAIGVEVRNARKTSRQVNYNSYAAGETAGDRASLGRPLGGGNPLLK
jgi:hypothetical protein